MGKTYIYKLIFLLLAETVFGNSVKSEWVNKTPNETSKFVYIVGSSSGFTKEDSAIKDATNNAREKAILELFGAEFKIEQNTEESLSKSEVNTKTKLESEQVKLIHFKTKEVYKELDNNIFSVWVLIEYSKTELEKEKKRLADIQVENKLNVIPSSESKEFNNGGKPKLRKGLKKSQVIEMFGAPIKVSKLWDGETSFMFKNELYCEHDYCHTDFKKGKLDGWTDFKPIYTTDLDDDEIEIKKVKTQPRKISAQSKINKSNDTPNSYNTAHMSTEALRLGRTKA